MEVVVIVKPNVVIGNDALLMEVEKKLDGRMFGGVGRAMNSGKRHEGVLFTYSFVVTLVKSRTAKDTGSDIVIGGQIVDIAGVVVEGLGNVRRRSFATAR